MRAILIDATNRQVSVFQWSGHNRELYAQLNCDCFCQVSRAVSGNNMLLVDDNGLLKDSQAFFSISTYYQPLAGNAVIIGYDAMGESVSTDLVTEDILALITWMSRDDFDGWAIANSGMPCVTLTESDGVETVLHTYGDMAEAMLSPVNPKRQAQ